MNRARLIIAALLIMVAASMPAKAQLYSNNDLGYHSFRSPMATKLNPAMFPNNAKFYVTMPRFDIDFSLPLGFSDVIMHDNEGAVIRIDSIMNKMTVKNQMRARLGLNFGMDMVGFGFRIKDMYFNFGSGMKVNTTVTLPLNTLRLLTDGNFGEYGREGNVTDINLGDDNIFRLQMYMHYSLGFAMKIPNTDATVGLRLNLLNGLEMVALDKLGLHLITDSANTRLMATTDLYAYTSGVAPIVNDSKGLRINTDMFNDFNMNTVKQLLPKSMGFTFDLGAKYEWKDFVFSASIIDLGPGIHWTQNPVQLSTKGNDTVSFEGIDLNRVISQGGVDTGYTNSLKDSLMALLDTAVTTEKFWYAIPTKVYLGASWSLNNMLRFGALFHGEFEPGKNSKVIFRQNTTLSVHFNLFDWLELAAANSFTFDGRRPDFFSPSASISFNIGRVFQLYLTLDYLSDMRVTKMKAAHLYFGANIVGYTKPNKIKHSSQGELKLEVE
ncbi:MAG: hypothetical protein J5526_04495 [Bacteroidales bacterium]|nr:hypothetical protein [Bacteroidales bacterium]